ISAAGIAGIMLACLGLLGLTTLALVNRTREIGIRKVLGASVADITSILSRDLLKLVIIAIVVALPFAGWVMNKWLENYPYRINIQWWVFALCGVGIILLSFATIGLLAVRAALKNPAANLRVE
ncbi:MAG TPA: FtsX-like permease family protein, partial [Puia sp.]|nr:FtsX-like permease family protein [Puia sp.]